MFLIFKQYYTYFHTFFYPHVFSKNTNNFTRTILPNGPSILCLRLCIWFGHFGPFQQPVGAKQPGHWSKSTDTTYKCIAPIKEHTLYLLHKRFWPGLMHALK